MVLVSWFGVPGGFRGKGFKAVHSVFFEPPKLKP